MSDSKEQLRDMCKRYAAEASAGEMRFYPKDEDDEDDASPGWRSVADTIPASPWKWHVVGT